MKTEVYALPELDCPNCAMKVERQVGKIKGLNEVTVDFVHKKMIVEFEGDSKKEQIIQAVKKAEPDINVVEITDGKDRVRSNAQTENRDHHHEEECGCGHEHHHDHADCDGKHDHHHHEEGCGCGHEHHHDHADCDDKHDHHHYDESCGCGHDHYHEHADCDDKHEHHHHEKGCGCGHEHHHEHADCDGEHEHHHHEEGCSCGHDHEEIPTVDHSAVKGELKLRLAGLDCANCAAKIERAVNAMPEVEEASVTFSTETLLVDAKPSSDREALIEAITAVVKKLEPEVAVVEMKTGTKQPEPEVKPQSFFRQNAKLLIGIGFFIAGIILQAESYVFILFLISFLLIGGEVVYSAIRNVLQGEWFDETFLMSVATIGAFAIGDYKEGVAVMLFYQIGELFQSYAVNRSRKSIGSLMNIRAEYATVVRNGKEMRVDPENVMIGEMILIKPGERVPLDGILTEGETSLDTSALTGESLPRDAQSGDEILAGMVNLSGVVQVKVTKEFGESTVSRILELVENASSKKAPIERFITKFARVYTPTVVVAAILVAVIPPFLLQMGSFEVWLYRALTFLVVSCPCALVISIPLGLFAGIGGASRQGILVKGGNFLEILKDVDTVVFDKTGTLTQGTFSVTRIQPVHADADSLLQLAAYGEAYSNHPIARSIVAAYGQPIDNQAIRNYKEISGQGVEVEVSGRKLALGNTKLMQAQGLDCPAVEEIGTIIHVAQEGEYLGWLVISDVIKNTSAAAISQLKQAGVRNTVMLTGDNRKVAEAVAAQIGIDTVYAQLLPQDKVEQVETLLAAQPEGKKLAFVGDGINDAPVLARADLGVAMGGVGSDAAIEAADIVLMKDDPAALATAIQISRKTHAILRQNIIFSLAIKIGVLILTLFGKSNMWMGVFADVGVTLLAILNSMRALKVQ
ncbi:heavy metal translocating P-type ATPase [Holdemania massiliensis]|uniref:heavy metal translocating P-type ATPase n=1 Tax=Holdemania massiliensis TaxID=1468449 RepID=UPI001F051239|nr:heavy metal translocating P-type ATPase [Holdemania massiliensis]MCH1941163.1 cadmium-translocating P-type ATPase [Holdemania massiliensis]